MKIQSSERSAAAEIGYDRLARWYCCLEYLRFGGRLQAARRSLLKHLPESRHALFLGDGDGRLLECFVLAQPDCRITSVDLSKQMLALQRKRIEKHRLAIAPH